LVSATRTRQLMLLKGTNLFVLKAMSNTQMHFVGRLPFIMLRQVSRVFKGISVNLAAVIYTTVQVSTSRLLR
jgi:hypothetical protein